ncbi:MAG: amino acid carrier protein [Firmicutes bacterium]|nr:amino acid carrier protein [Bacillota bacterium]
MAEHLAQINAVLWGWPMIGLLCAAHLLLTLRTGFIQRKMFLALRLSFCRGGEDGEWSPFAALSTALASTVGTGSIVGVGAAIALGGPGAAFWLWIAGFFAFATKYGEALLGVKYRVRDGQGRMLGGAMYVLSRGLGLPGAGMLFALCAVLASFGIGSAVQARTAASLLSAELGLEPLAAGLLLAVLAAVVLRGGGRSIVKACAVLVPLMTALYLLCCCYILWHNRCFLLPAMTWICRDAFSGRAAGGAAGGGMLLALRYGLARGLFSNEAGMGSAPLADAAAQTPNAPRQALISASAVFWDTLAVCALTALVLVSQMLAHPQAFPPGLDGGALTAIAFRQISPAGPVVLLGGMIAFAFSSVLGWHFYGERCCLYLWGEKSLPVYRLLYLAALPAGAVCGGDLVWGAADLLNALMCLPNLLSLFLLSRQISQDTAYFVYGGRLKERQSPWRPE